MLQAISEIGIFMIVARAVVYFAPGRQYEKYIRSIAGVMILLLFLQPFFRLFGLSWEEAGKFPEGLEEPVDLPAFPKEALENGAGGVAVSRMEAEVKALLNKELEGEEYRVSRVHIDLKQESQEEEGALIPEVEVVMEKNGGQQRAGKIGIEAIVVGAAETDGEPQENFSDYRRRFAGILGIEEENLEVRADGRG